MRSALVFALSLALMGPLACKKKPKKTAKKDPKIGQADPSKGGAGTAKVKKGRRPPRKCQPPPAEELVPPDPNLPNIREKLSKRALTLKVMKKLIVRDKPSTQSENLGEIKRYSRLPFSVYLSGRDGCRSYWMRVMPRGWVCGDFLRGDRREVLMRRQPIMKKREMLPGLYAWVRRGGADLFPNENAAKNEQPAMRMRGGDIVRWVKSLSLNGTAYWRISKKYLVKQSRLYRHYPSKFQGVDLRAMNMMPPLAIVRAKTRGAAVYDRPGGKEIARVKHHSKWEIFDTKRVGITKYYRIGEGRWILARRVISAWPSKPPPGTKPCEKWLEINIEQQSLVAYEGTEPVYATMISSGLKKYPTKYGIFRIWWKKAQTDMTSSMAGSERYRVDDVPWAQFFYLGQALHGAYWHSEWGNRRSHGCVNLSPKDSRWLYDWTVPHVPKGWISRRGNAKYPGTLVRVVHKNGHEVAFKRYARKLAPPDAVKRLDEAYKSRMKAKTDRMFEHRARKDRKKNPGG